MILKPTEYNILYRKILTENNILPKNKMLINEFIRVKPSLLYWAADPFIVQINNKTFLFAEVANRITSKGKICYCEIIGNTTTKWKTCLKETYHLSYPNLYIKNDKIYMIPESSQNDSLDVYESNLYDFSFKKIFDYKIDHKFVDTNFFNGNFYAYDEKKCEILIFDYNLYLQRNVESFNIIQDYSKCLRPAGKFIWNNGELLFPSQDCSVYYGGGLIFNIVDCDKSITIKSKTKIDYAFLNQIFKTHKFYGIHTYNKTENYEVIDVQNSTFNFFSFLGKIYGLFRKIFNSIFSKN